MVYKEKSDVVYLRVKPPCVRLCTVHPHKAALTSSLSQSVVNWKILHSRAVIQRKSTLSHD